MFCNCDYKWNQQDNSKAMAQSLEEEWLGLSALQNGEDLNAWISNSWFGQSLQIQQSLGRYE